MGHRRLTASEVEAATRHLLGGPTPARLEEERGMAADVPTPGNGVAAMRLVFQA